MTSRGANLALMILAVMYSFLQLNPLCAQVSNASLSGRIIGPMGAGIANAKVTVKNAATGESADTQTSALGNYNFANLSPGDYEISVSAEGFTTKAAKATLAPGGKKVVDLTLVAVSANAGEPSLQDLGFSPSQTKGSAAEQARLNKRSHMLKVHQELGLVTAAPMLATIFTSFGAKEHHGVPGSASGRQLHAALGIATTDLYFTSAYFAIRAPKVHDEKVKGPIRVHKALAWVHATGMIMTPILGGIAYAQESRGERVHGIASAHAAVATVTYASLGAAIIAVSVKF